MRFPRTHGLPFIGIKVKARKERLDAGKAHGQIPAMSVYCILDSLCEHLLQSSLHSWIHTVREKASTSTTLHRHTVHLPEDVSCSPPQVPQQLSLLTQAFMPTSLPVAYDRCSAPAKGTGPLRERTRALLQAMMLSASPPNLPNKIVLKNELWVVKEKIISLFPIPWTKTLKYGSNQQVN